MLYYSGKLLVGTEPAPYGRVVSGPDRLALPGFQLDPLFPSFLATLRDDPDRIVEHWFVASPEDVDENENPWDAAHRVASASGYSVYVEPDLLHGLRGGDEDLKQLNPHWPPHKAVSPAWHLESTYTGFADVRSISTGAHVRIAHLDTGYAPHQMSRPRRLCPELGWDYFANSPVTVDPGIPGFLQSGHGTATLAVLAGNWVDLVFAGEHYEGDFGGAPDAEVVPVRIGPSVAHLFTTRIMAKGIDHAIAPRGRVDKKCHVLSISHGGLPSKSVAAAVNHAYDAGIVIVAASGDYWHTLLVDVPPHETVWPSRLKRVITAVGVTYDHKPYVTDELFVMQGSWGPPSVMEKAVAAYTPNIAWMNFKQDHGFTMDGGGTSMSTPQIAAACALWLDVYRAGLTDDWRRAAACTKALLDSAVPVRKEDQKYLGKGALSVPRLLATQPLADQGMLAREPEADVESLTWQALGKRAARSQQEKMLEVEFLQATLRFRDPEAIGINRRIEEGGGLRDGEASRIIRAVVEDPDSSNALRTFLLR
jgi:hypothetical protein